MLNKIISEERMCKHDMLREKIKMWKKEEKNNKTRTNAQHSCNVQKKITL